MYERPGSLVRAADVLARLGRDVAVERQFEVAEGGEGAVLVCGNAGRHAHFSAPSSIWPPSPAPLLHSRAPSSPRSKRDLAHAIVW